MYREQKSPLVERELTFFEKAFAMIAKRIPSLFLQRLVCSAVFLLIINPVSASDLGFKLNENLIIQRGSLGPWSSGFIDPGATIYHEGKFHMLLAAVAVWPEQLVVGYATSENGLDWRTESESPVLQAKDTGLDFWSIASNSVVINDDNEWVFYFSLIYPGKFFTGEIGRATASSPLGPWKTDTESVLKPGPEGSWDGDHIGNASVVKTSDGYRMYYTGTGTFQNGAFSEQRENVGMAYSTDGIHWTKYNDPSTNDAHFADSDPVLLVSGIPESWDSLRITDTNVQKVGDEWVMVYRGSSFNDPGALGLATSNDGIDWRRASDTPFLTNKDVGNTIYFINYLHHDGSDYVYFESGNTNGTDVRLSVRPRLF